jgi:itaconate CoA-transferase
MGGTAPARTGASHATIAPYGPYQTRDGQVIFGIQSSREWSAFSAHVLGRPVLADDERFQSNHSRVQHREALDAEIDQVFGSLSTADVVARLDAAQIANARINTVEQFIDHPQLAGRDAWRQVNSPRGPLPALVPPVRMEDVEPVMGAIPALGEHSGAILAELGFDAATIEQWKKEGVI